MLTATTTTQIGQDSPTKGFPDHLYWAVMALGPISWLLLWLVNGQPRVPAANIVPKEFILVVLIYPVLEEIVFRCGLQGWLMQKTRMQVSFYGFSLANLIVSLVFTGLHFFYHPPLWAALVLLPSLVFGWSRDRYQIMAAPIGLHIFYNFGIFTMF